MINVKSINRIRIFFAVNMVLIIIFFVIIPGIKETGRQGKVTEQDIKTYIKNSQTVKLTSYEIIGKNRNREKYFDDAPLVRKPSKKNYTVIKDKKTKKIYKVELYHRQSIMPSKRREESIISLRVNREELNKSGTMEQPIIALRYASGLEDYDNHVLELEYLYNVREYLTYKDHVPIPNDSPLYYIPMIWAAIVIAGFS